MFERDKDGLRDAGIPIESVPLTIDYGAGKIDAYALLKKNFHLPYLRIVADASGTDIPDPRHSTPRGAKRVTLREDESTTAFHALESVAEIPSFPLRTEARSAWRKLSFDLVPPPGKHGRSLCRSSDVCRADGRTRDRSPTRCSPERPCGSEYHGIYRGTRPTDRVVRPYGVLFQYGHWYVIGYDESREDVRVFRVERMEEPLPNQKSRIRRTTTFRAEFSLEEFRTGEAWELGSGEDGNAQGAREIRVSRCRCGPSETGSVRWSRTRREVLHPDVRIRQVAPFLRWILGQRGEARIVEPAGTRRTGHGSRAGGDGGLRGLGRIRWLIALRTS